MRVNHIPPRWVSRTTPSAMKRVRARPCQPQCGRAPHTHATCRRGAELRARTIWIGVFGAVASADRLPLPVSAIRAGWQMVARAHVDLVAALRAFVSAGAHVAAGGDWVSHVVFPCVDDAISLAFRRPVKPGSRGRAPPSRTRDDDRRPGKAGFARRRARRRLPPTGDRAYGPRRVAQRRAAEVPAFPACSTWSR
jgi:hypothetical protein